jgi:nitrite reductase/ring-hydroxylating ferredoxin subunit
MPEAVDLCDSTELVDGGPGRVFEALLDDESVSAFVVRHEGQVHGYLNRCAHMPAELDWQPGRFFDADGQWLVCSMHGALYAPDTGLCVSGPCPGRSLRRLQVTEDNGRVSWYPEPPYLISHSR